MSEHSTDSKYLVLMDDSPDGELSTMQVIFGLDALCTAIDKIAWDMAPAAHEGVSIYSLTAIAKAHAKRLSSAVTTVPLSVHAVDQSANVVSDKPTDTEGAPEQPDPDERTKEGPPDWDTDAREAARHCLAISERAIYIANAADVLVRLETTGEGGILDAIEDSLGNAGSVPRCLIEQVREAAYQILAFETHLADAILKVRTFVTDFPQLRSGLFQFQDVSESASVEGDTS